MKVWDISDVGRYGEIHHYDAGLNPKMRHVDAELTRLRARTCVSVTMNGDWDNLDVFLDADHRLVAAVRFDKLVSKEWLAAFERRFGKQVAQSLNKP